MSYLDQMRKNERDSEEERRARQEPPDMGEYCVFCGGYEGIDEEGNECEYCTVDIENRSNDI